MANPISPMYSSAPQGSMFGPTGGFQSSANRNNSVSLAAGGWGGNTTLTPISRSRSAGQQNVQSERVLSSNVVGETMLGPMPQEEIQYVEVPVIEEIIKHVPKKEVVEIEKRVPKYEYEWVERVVEVPQVHFVDKQVEIPQIQEVIRHVPIKKYVDIPKEIIRHVPKVEIKIVEKEVEVPGEIIDVPKPYLVENKIVVPRYVDRDVATVVSQKLVPVITESETEYVDVDLKEYNPYLVAVDVYVPRPIARQLIATSKTEEHRVVDVPVGQFNALLRQMNGHVADSEMTELLVKDQRGAIPIMPVTAGALVVAPVNDEWEISHNKGGYHYNFNAPVGQINTSTVTTSIPLTTAATAGGSTYHHSKVTTTTTGGLSSSYYPATTTMTTGPQILTGSSSVISRSGAPHGAYLQSNSSVGALKDAKALAAYQQQQQRLQMKLQQQQQQSQAISGGGGQQTIQSSHITSTQQGAGGMSVQQRGGSAYQQQYTSSQQYTTQQTGRQQPQYYPTSAQLQYTPQQHIQEAGMFSDKHNRQ